MAMIQCLSLLVIFSSNETLNHQLVLASTLIIKSQQNKKKINSYKIKEEKKPATKSHKNKKKKSVYKAFKCKVKGLKDTMFESGAVKHAAQFTKSLKEIAKNFKDVEHP